MYKNSIKNMPQKVCIRKKWPIFVVYLKWARILKKTYQRVQQILNWFTRGHSNLELCKCHFKFSWISVQRLLSTRFTDDFSGAASPIGAGCVFLATVPTGTFFIKLINLISFNMKLINKKHWPMGRK